MKTNKVITKKNILFTDTSSIYSEAFQYLQVNLDFSFVDKKSRVVGVTSSLPSEGKSTIISNLAFIYAKKGFKVCLVDLDLRKPTIHRFFSLTNELGVTDFCTGKAKKEEIIKKVEDVSIITAGTISPFPGVILESSTISTLIDELKKEFEYVFIDTSPVLASPDAILISKFVDQYVIVARYGKTKKNELDEVMHQFKNNNLKVAGVVMNSVELDKKKGYSYKYRY